MVMAEGVSRKVTGVAEAHKTLFLYRVLALGLVLYDVRHYEVVVV